MALANDPSRLNKRIAFGTTIPSNNIGEIAVSHDDSNFQESFSVWCGIWNRSLSEKFQVIGTEHQDDVTVIIRHNPNVNQSLLAKLDGVTYRVIDVAPDDSPNPVTFDLVTMKRVTQ